MTTPTPPFDNSNPNGSPSGTPVGQSHAADNYAANPTQPSPNQSEGYASQQSQQPPLQQPVEPTKKRPGLVAPILSFCASVVLWCGSIFLILIGGFFALGWAMAVPTYDQTAQAIVTHVEPGVGDECFIEYDFTVGEEKIRGSVEIATSVFCEEVGDEINITYNPNDLTESAPIVDGEPPTLTTGVWLFLISTVTGVASVVWWIVRGVKRRRWTNAMLQQPYAYDAHSRRL